MFVNLWHNNAINSDSKKRRTFVAPLFTAGYGERWRGRYAPRHRRCALPSAFWPALTRLAIKRLQRTVVPASKLACTSAADPQRRSIIERKTDD